MHLLNDLDLSDRQKQRLNLIARHLLSYVFLIDIGNRVFLLTNVCYCFIIKIIPNIKYKNRPKYSLYSSKVIKMRITLLTKHRAVSIAAAATPIADDNKSDMPKHYLQNS
jgi:hypothetical protein